LTLPALAPADFAAFFAAVHRVPPFPWQDRLLHQIAEDGRWPAVLDLPTGSGKTAALDIAVFHLALEASRGPERQAPIRIAFVVDRRLIVDDAFIRAERLGAALRWAMLGEEEARREAHRTSGLTEIIRRIRAEPVVHRVGLRLRHLAGHREPALLARRLRGGAPREDDWARTPNQPTILCSTVDQVGSRLLFRGYGISDRMKPIHAGLLGSDCLILLDEAHLAEPFRQTLQAVARLRTGDSARWDVALLTATPGGQGEVQFSLKEDDRGHPVLSKRLSASKPTKLVEIPGKQGVPVEQRRTDELAERTKAVLAELRKTIPAPGIGIVVNRVARARAVFERLKQDLAEASIALIIGPARSADREQQVADYLSPIRTGAERRLNTPLILVATQTIEAGVDIDLDGLITEAAPLDALRQRFGRLNRSGRPISPVAAILAHREDFGPKADDPVYGDRIGNTWAALQAAAAPNGTMDFGIEAFPQVLLDQSPSLVSLKPDSPVLFPAYAHLWSQTWPIPNADPEVGLFLHGPKQQPASVQVVWRADLSAAELEDRDYVLEILKRVPPRPGETIEIPLWTARAWLHSETESLAVLSDAVERAPDLPVAGRGRRAFCYAGTDSDRSRAVWPDAIHPGDLIVVPATPEYGGCDQWGWNPTGRMSVADLAETAAWPYRGRRYAVRVTAELIQQHELHSPVPDATEPPADLEAIRDRLHSALADAVEEGDAPSILEAVWAMNLPKTLRNWLQPLQDRAYRGKRLPDPFIYRAGAGRPRGVIFIAPFGLKEEAEAEDVAAPPATESDDIGLFGGYPLLLEQHSEEVREAAAEFACRAGLLDTVAADVALAGYLHDVGKSDPRFQAFLAGGDLLGWDETRLLAKSGRDRLPRDAWERARLPRNWRHEALSVRLARSNPEFSEAHDPMLVLWLVGVHHGFGRPLFPHTDPDEPIEQPGPQSLGFDFNGRDWARIFEELKRTYGIWGLARLEAFVRLADHRASEAAARRYAEG
jgi:CRISPR-associated endonuclease/helicase Cas3